MKSGFHWLALIVLSMEQATQDQVLDNVRFAKFVCPDYPRIALLAKVHGPVLLDVTVDERGIPTEIRAVKGHPMLVATSIDAACQWRFRPCVIGKTTLAVNISTQLRFDLNPDPRHRCHTELPVIQKSPGIIHIP